MKHIRLFENFEDVVDQTTRDIFDLTSEFRIYFDLHEWAGTKREEYCMIKGPSENSEAAKQLIFEIQSEVDKLEDAYEKYINEFEINDLFDDEGYHYRLQDIGYYVYYKDHNNSYLKYVPPANTTQEVKEGYRDEVGDSARDIFGLVHTIEVYDLFGSTGIAISGPSEESVKANTIVREIESEIHKRLPNPRSAPRFIWIETVNDIMKRRKSDLSEIGYKIDTWYSGAESPELSR
jgi:hypothetical protein